MSATGVQREVINDKGKKEMKWFGAVDPFDSVTIASVCMNVFRTKFIEEEWRVKLEGKNKWMWDLIVSVPDHCLSFYFTKQTKTKKRVRLGDSL